MVNNIFTCLMLLPATKRHSILMLLVTASTLPTAKGLRDAAAGTATT